MVFSRQPTSKERKKKMKNRKNRGKLGVQERMNSIKLVQFLLTPLIHPSLPYIQFSPLNPVVKISYSTNYPQLAYTAGIVTNYQLSTNIPTHRSTTHTLTNYILLSSQSSQYNSYHKDFIPFTKIFVKRTCRKAR